MEESEDNLVALFTSGNKIPFDIIEKYADEIPLIYWPIVSRGNFKNNSGNSENIPWSFIERYLEKACLKYLNRREANSGEFWNKFLNGGMRAVFIENIIHKLESNIQRNLQLPYWFWKQRMEIFKSIANKSSMIGLCCDPDVELKHVTECVEKYGEDAIILLCYNRNPGEEVLEHIKLLINSPEFAIDCWHRSMKSIVKFLIKPYG